MVRSACLLLLLLLLLSACVRPPASAPEATGAVWGFYRVVMTRTHGGIPGKETLDRLRPFISTRLAEALAAADAAEHMYYQKTHGQVPPLVQGSFFFSLFEGPTRMVDCLPERIPGQSSCLARFENQETADGKPFQWQDRAFLVQENGRWVVDDLQLLRPWDFGPKGQLSELIRMIVRDAEQAETLPAESK